MAEETDNTAFRVTIRDANVGHKSLLGIGLNNGDGMQTAFLFCCNSVATCIEEGSPGFVSTQTHQLGNIAGIKVEAIKHR